MAKMAAEVLAAEALDFRYDALPPEVAQKAKQLMLNSLGSGLLGHSVEPSRIIEGLAAEMSGPADCTVLGSGMKTSLVFATLANVAKVANTGHWEKNYYTPEANFHLGPNRQLIPAVLTVAEHAKATGKQALAAVVCAYEMANKIQSTIRGQRGLEDRGWTNDSVGRPCALAMASGLLLGLDQQQMVSAIAMAGTFSLAPAVMDSNSTRFHLRSPMPMTFAVMAALLAQRGYPGPPDIFEGRNGLKETAMGGDMDIERLMAPRSEWTILKTGINRTSASGDVRGVVDAVLTLVNEHDIKPEDVENIIVWANDREVQANGDPNDPNLRSPRSRPTAVHSLFYLPAIIIVDRAVDFEQFLEARFANPDPRIEDLMGRVTVEVEPKFVGFNQTGGSASITTKNGQRFDAEVLHPKGLHPLNPMNNEEHEQNFRVMASRVIGEPQIRQIVDTIYGIEKLEDAGDVMRMLVIPGEQ